MADGGDPTSYVFSEAMTAFDSLSLAEDDPTTPDVDEGDCCFDYDDDGEPDNGMGGLLQSLGSFLGASLPEGGVNGLIAEQVASGELVVYLEQKGLGVAAGDMTPSDPSINLAVLFGRGDGPTYTVGPASFWEGTATPTLLFDNGQISDGILTAGPTQGGGGGATSGGFFQDMHTVRIQAQAYRPAGADGLTIDDGILGGLVPLTVLSDGLNDTANACSCLGLGGAGMLELAAQDKLACTQEMKDASPTCIEATDGALCMGLADNKGIVCTAIGILKPDIDTDEDGTKDSFSIGFRFTGVPVTVSGLGDDAAGLSVWSCTSSPSSPLGLPFVLLALLALVVRGRRRRVA